MRLQNLTPETYASNSQSAGQKRKRNRQPISCQPCRDRKVACDREQPCSNCAKSRGLSECIYGVPEAPLTRPTDTNGSTTASSRPNEAVRSETRQSVSSTASPGGMEERMMRLERTIESIATKIDSIASTPSSVQTHRTNSGNNDLPAQASIGPIAGATVRERRGSDSVLATKQPGVVFYIGKTGWSMGAFPAEVMEIWKRSFPRFWQGCHELSNSFVSFRMGTILDSAPAKASPPNAETVMLSMIPEREVCDVLYRRYLITFGAIQPVLVPETFEKEMAVFWVQREPLSTTWLALYVGILGLGYQLPVIPLPQGYQPQLDRVRGADMIDFVRSYIFAPPLSRSLKRPSLTTFQVLLLPLLSIALKIPVIDGNDEKSGLLGLATRMAMTMGLHRQPHLGSGAHTHIGQVHDVPAEDIELRRMLWNTLTFISMEHSVQTGMPYLIHESDCDLETISINEKNPSLYQRRIAIAMPTWARIVQMNHSSRSKLSETEISTLRLRMTGLSLPTPEMPTIGPELDHMPVLIQQAMYDCFHARMTGILYDTTTIASDLSTRYWAEETRFHGAMRIINHRTRLATSIEALNVEDSARDAWAHFIFTLLHCNFFKALRTVTSLIETRLEKKVLRNMDSSQDGQMPLEMPSDIDHNEIFDMLTAGDRSILDRAACLSPASVKEHMLAYGFVASAKERARLSFEHGRLQPDLTGAGAEPVIEAMKGAMDRAINIARASIVKAQKSDDPPPGLYSEQPMEELDEVVGETSQQSAAEKTFAEGTHVEMSTMNDLPTDGIDGNLADSDWMLDMLFPDLDPNMPWWSPPPPDPYGLQNPM